MPEKSGFDRSDLNAYQLQQVPKLAIDCRAQTVTVWREHPARQPHGKNIQNVVRLRSSCLSSGGSPCSKLQHLHTQPRYPNKPVLLANYPNPFNPGRWDTLSERTPSDENHIQCPRGVVRQLALGHQPGTFISRSRAAYWDGRESR